MINQFRSYLSSISLREEGKGEGLISLFLTFAYIGLFTIGGGYAMIPLIQQKVVEEKGWVTEEELVDLMAVAQSCPGIFAVNIAIFIGYKLRGVPGALATTLAAITPSFVIILLIALIFAAFRENKYVERFFLGLRPAVVALIAAPTFKMAKTAKVNLRNIWIPILAVLLICIYGMSPIYVVLAAGVGGYVWGQWVNKEED